jgi:putative ABC transport system ATP-binding protein
MEAQHNKEQVIVLENIVKTYSMGDSSFNALDGINLSIEQGSFVAIMGPSGSGKSTMMNIIGCLDRPTSGAYWLDGQQVADLSDDELALVRNEKIGFVFQNFNLLPRMNALHNVALPLIYAGVPLAERLKRAEKALIAVGLGDRIQHKPNEMSGGQRQRVAIARAMVNEPAILMADEPTGNLDTKSGDEVMRLFTAIHEQGRTVILVTHEPEIAAYTERTLVMRDGKIVQDEMRA